MQVLFSPQKPGQQSVDYLDVIALGATNCSVIKCIGIGKGEVLIIIITIIIIHLVLSFLSLTLHTYWSVSLSILLLSMIKLHHNIHTDKVLWILAQTYHSFFFLQLKERKLENPALVLVQQLE